MERGSLVHPAPPVAGSRRQIARAQELLNRCGAKLRLNGSLDADTKRALGRFQERHGLRKTRKLDVETTRLLASFSTDTSAS